MFSLWCGHKASCQAGGSCLGPNKLFSNVMLWSSSLNIRNTWLLQILRRSLMIPNESELTALRRVAHYGMYNGLDRVENERKRGSLVFLLWFGAINWLHAPSVNFNFQPFKCKQKLMPAWNDPPVFQGLCIPEPVVAEVLSLPLTRSLSSLVHLCGFFSP